jgi:hypothetical protein
MNTAVLDRTDAMVERTSLVKFMIGPDNPIFAKMICYFSSAGKYCHPRELKKFWESLTEREKDYYRAVVPTLVIELS